MILLSTHWEITARKRMVWLQQFISDFIFQFAAKKAKEMGRKIAWDEKKNTKLIQISSSLKTSLVLRYFARQGVLFARFLRHTTPLGTPVYLAFFARHFFFFACSLFHVTIYDLQHQHNHSSNQACFITVILPSILRYLCFAFYIQLLYIYINIT